MSEQAYLVSKALGSQIVYKSRRKPSNPALRGAAPGHRVGGAEPTRRAVLVETGRAKNPTPAAPPRGGTTPDHAAHVGGPKGSSARGVRRISGRTAGAAAGVALLTGGVGVAAHRSRSRRAAGGSGYPQASGYAY